MRAAKGTNYGTSITQLLRHNKFEIPEDEWSFSLSSVVVGIALCSENSPSFCENEKGVHSSPPGNSDGHILSLLLRRGLPLKSKAEDLLTTELFAVEDFSPSILPPPIPTSDNVVDGLYPTMLVPGLEILTLAPPIPGMARKGRKGINGAVFSLACGEEEEEEEESTGSVPKGF